MMQNDYEVFKTKLKDYPFKFNSNDLFNIIKAYDSCYVNKVFTDLINNMPTFNGLNIIYEMRTALNRFKQKKINIEKKIASECLEKKRDDEQRENAFLKAKFNAFSQKDKKKVQGTVKQKIKQNKYLTGSPNIIILGTMSNIILLETIKEFLENKMEK